MLALDGREADDGVRWRSGIKRVLLVGRRGSAQAAFTMKELRELTKLDEVACVVNPENLKQGLTPASLDEIKEQRAKKRQHELLSTFARGLWCSLLPSRLTW